MAGVQLGLSLRATALAGAVGLVAATVCCLPLAAQQLPPAPARPAVTVTAPAAPTGAAEAAAKAVEGRATAYWEARQRHDFVAVYDFYSSLYRAKVARDAFINSMRAGQQEVRDTRVADVKVTGTRAVVTVAYRMLAPTVKEQWVDSRNDEVWIREADGMWRKLEEPMALPAPSSTTTPAFPPTVSTPAFPVTVTTPAFPPDAAIPVPTSGAGDAASSPNRPDLAPPTGR